MQNNQPNLLSIFQSILGNNQSQTNSANNINTTPNNINTQSNVNNQSQNINQNLNNLPPQRNLVHIVHTTTFNLPGNGQTIITGSQTQNRNSNLSGLLQNLFGAINNFGAPPEDTPRPTSTECIRTLPRITPTENDLAYMLCKECTICKEDYKTEEKLIELPCKHTFHEDCILPWLNIHSSCPTCRYALPARD